MHAGLTRKDFLKSVIIGAASAALPLKSLAQGQTVPDYTIQDLKSFAKLTGVSFTDEELKEILGDMKDWLAGYESVRKLPINELTQPPTIFVPRSLVPPQPGHGLSVKTTGIRNFKRPLNDNDLAFLTLAELAHLIQTRQVTSLELVELSIKRLSLYGDKLMCVVTLLAEPARKRAIEMDRELRSGKNRGPLHGIPCGVKDLFALRNAPTTWGAEPFRNQQFSYDAAVVERLEAAGAIVVAKLSMGALAMNDVWFKGKTRNPWNPKQGSSGSSAGSASATAAGLVPFALGTETLGSICSPSHQCRVTGLRPTYGRVSRFGAMELSYTMDKVGPICRTAEDCAIVFSAISGHDSRDPSSVDRPFHYRSDIDLSKLKIGYPVGPEDGPAQLTRIESSDYMQTLKALGANPRPVRITPMTNGLLTILEAEAESAFDEFTRDGRVRQLKDSLWPESFRASRFVPAAEYLQAMRGRSLLMDSFEKELGDFDLLVAPNVAPVLLRITNLTGHPQVLVPNGVDEKSNSRSVSFVGRIYHEATILAVANKFQQKTQMFRHRPDLSVL